MPELPEVEVVCRGLTPLLTGRQVERVNLFCTGLRYPFPQDLAEVLSGLTFAEVRRRAKYILFRFDQEPLLVWHLGMTGQFHVLEKNAPLMAHEHVRFELNDGHCLCYRDPRRFGFSGLIRSDALEHHAWFNRLGQEPLQEGFNVDYLYGCCRGSKAPIKSLLMNAAVVVGVGNIYASESLFRSGIHPARAADKISRERLGRLVETIKVVLAEAIEAGGSSISDFVNADGKPGYFAHQFRVYGREGQACSQCGRPIKRLVQSGRSSFYCVGCQR
jgi:formamidopyrimidine-DNA glycosylase